MRYSLCTRSVPDNIAGTNGFGYATLGMLDSLKRLGYQIEANDATADVEIAFDQPHEVKWNNKNNYHILYVPWESTELIPGWLEIMNEADEVWTPSPLIKGWFRAAGVEVPIFVYEHGVDHVWSPVKRIPGDKIKFLHVGAEATRKGGWDVVRNFRRAFPNRHDVSLTIKMINSSWNKIPNLGRVSYINEKYNFSQIHNLFYRHDVYVYPSYGEGFGLTPLQALATGMPTITCPAWAPYAEFLDDRLLISSKLAKSSWQEIHPGYMLRPSTDDTIDRMRYAADNYDEVRDYACITASDVHERYDWDTITSDVFSALEKRLSS